MNADIAKIILDAWKASPDTTALFVDDAAPHADSCVRIADGYIGVDSDELWLLPGRGAEYGLAVITAARSALELYRVLASLEAVITRGGSILIAPYATSPGVEAENRFEATECFLGAHAGWSRELIGANVIALKRDGASAEVAPKTTTVTAVAAPRVEVPVANKAVISLSLFGKGGYHQYARSFVLAHHTLFPNYELRIHHDDALYSSEYGGALHALAARGLVKLVHMAADGLERGKCAAMLWRLAPAWDPSVEHVFARDIDALPTWNERCCVEEFLASSRLGETECHTIHANSAHAGIMGGLCGFRSTSLRAQAPLFSDFLDGAHFSPERWAQHGADQDYLNARVVLDMRVFEHSVFVYIGADGKRLVRQPSDWGNGHHRNLSTRFVTEIPTFDCVDVPSDDRVRERSNDLINYAGAAGYDVQRAIRFYEQYCPRIIEVRDAEAEAGFEP